MLGDNQLLYLVGAGKERSHAGITVVSLNGILVTQGVATVNLDRLEGELISEDLASIRNIFASNTADAKVGTATGPAGPWSEEQKSQAPDWRYFLVAAVLCLVLEVWLRDFRF